MRDSSVFVTTSELAELIKYDARTIRERLKDSVLIEGIHYVKPFGGRKILYDWTVIQKDMKRFSQDAMAIPMTSGGIARG